MARSKASSAVHNNILTRNIVLISEEKHRIRNILGSATHAVLSGPAIERIKNSVIEEMVFLNTIPMPEEAKDTKIKFLDVAPMFAEAIQRTYDEVSMSTMF